MRGDDPVLGPISMTDIVRYAGASGDLNPLHHDPEFAARGGYDRPVVMGALSSGWLAARLTPEYRRGPLTVTIAYRRPVMLGEVLRLDVTATGAVATRIGDGDETVVVSTDVEEKTEPAAAEGTPLVTPYQFVVEAGAVREFRRAVLADQPWAPIVPVTFPVTASRWRPNDKSAVRLLGFDYRRMLHSRSIFRYVDGPLVLGERLQVWEHHGPRSTKTRRDGSVMTVGSVCLTLKDGDEVRAQMESEMVELPERSSL
ncbi:MAG: hypothetical protein QOK15_3868 [Nocardioidaceae bacterium]|nr:hypothetical protein [Nocardioidaceae bacterium]